jgi:hypothetical protein
MGAVTAGYFTLLNDKPPIDYLWSKSAADPSHTYLKFQIISQILNSLLILPAFYILTKMFKKRVAIISCAFLITSPFFLYNSVFSWPKSLVAFFVLAMWLLLLENKRRYTIIAGIAGGLAYLTHDLAMFYIASGALMLLYHRRYKDTLILSGISASLALPWMFISSFIYKKPSTFILYPFSLDGLPQPGNQEAIIKKFLHTSPLEIISIRFDTLFYLLTPYDLIYKLGNQDIFRRIWAVSLYSVPGSLGLGLVIPTILGAIKKIQKLDFPKKHIKIIDVNKPYVGWDTGNEVGPSKIVVINLSDFTSKDLVYPLTPYSKLVLVSLSEDGLLTYSIEKYSNEKDYNGAQFTTETKTLDLKTVLNK